jgi:hypothetical protein
MIHNLLSYTEIADILNNHIVITNKDKLSSQNKVDFSIVLPVEIKAKIENGFGINLQQIASIPMRWIKGDTPQHIDKGEHDFNNTYLMYLTDSTGNLLIDEQSYPINAGDAYIFNEGIAHSTINTGDNERLMIGPMSEFGFHVGVAYYIVYFNNETDANESAASVDEYGYPDTTNAIYSNLYEELYTITTVNDISSWVIAANTNQTEEPTPNGGQYNTGDELIPSGIYYLYPYTTPDPDPEVPPTPTQTRSLYIRSLFTNNSQIYYKSGSLCTGSGGVTNSRIKKRRT